MSSPRPSSGRIAAHAETPQQWEEYVNRLAAHDAFARGACYQRVFSQTQGDAGLEGYTTDGHAFQAYLPASGKTKRDLTNALCRKLTSDLDKLDRYSTFWSQTLAAGFLKVWTLVVPSCTDKHVLEHARRKVEALRQKGLPFLSPDFCALVRTPEDFPTALQAISAEGLEYVRIPDGLPATDAQLRAFESERANKINDLNRKLNHLPGASTPNSLERIRHNLLRQYLEYQNGLEWLRQNLPPVLDDIIARRQGLRRSIETQSLVDERQPPERLRLTQEAFRAELDRVAPFIKSDQRGNMSWGVITEWLLECPLDFQLCQPTLPI